MSLYRLGELLVIIIAHGVTIRVAVAHPHIHLLPLQVVRWVAALYPLHRHGDGAIGIGIAHQIGMVFTHALCIGLNAYRSFDGEPAPVGCSIQILMRKLLTERPCAAVCLLRRHGQH